MEQIQAALISLAIAVIPVLGAFIIALINSKMKQINKAVKNTEIKKYIDIAKTSIVTAIDSVAQTYVNALKEGNTFDGKAQLKALQEAKLIVLDITSDTAKDILTEVYGDLDLWVETCIEAKILNLKKEQEIAKAVMASSPIMSITDFADNGIK